MMFVGLRDEMQPDLKHEFPESVYLGKAEAGLDCALFARVQTCKC